MVTQKLRGAGSGRMALCAVFITAVSFAAACDKMPLLAPTGTIITLIPTSNVVPVGGEVDIIDRYADFLLFVRDDVAVRRRIEERVRAAS